MALTGHSGTVTDVGVERILAKDIQVVRSCDAAGTVDQIARETTLLELAGAVAGGHMQADVVGALPAGANTIGGTKDAGSSWVAEHKVVNSANATAGVAVTDVPTGGQKRVMVEFVITTDTAMSITLKEETSATVMHGPFYLLGSSTIQIVPRSQPASKLATADKRYMVWSSAIGNITVETWTYSEA